MRAHHPAYPLHDARRVAFQVRVGVATELKVDAEQVVGLAVDQHAFARIE